MKTLFTGFKFGIGFTTASAIVSWVWTKIATHKLHKQVEEMLKEDD